MNTIKTLGELKQSGYKSQTIKDELRKNLCNKIKNKESVFEGVFGYENTVIPELELSLIHI
jgi:magnesium chelatase subunit I